MSLQQSNLWQTLANTDAEPGFSLVIRVDDTLPAQSPVIRHESTDSSLGFLDILPPEILLLAFEFLDFQSLSRLSRVSVKGKAMVEALKAYRDMMEHAPTTLTALARTRLISHHPASLLLQTLRSSKCVSCFKFGPYLLLPTCERVCSECCLLNQALWMTPVSVAQQCFALTMAQIQRIPIMESIPGTYSIRVSIRRHKVARRLVNIKQAKQLAIEVHGSIGQVARIMRRRFSGLSETSYRIPSYFLDAPLEAPGADIISKLGQEARYDNFDPFGGIACMRFPSLTRSGLEHGISCKGCKKMTEDHMQGLLPASLLSELVPPGANEARVMMSLFYQMHSIDGFWEHVKHCYGARKLIDESK